MTGNLSHFSTHRVPHAYFGDCADCVTNMFGMPLAVKWCMSHNLYPRSYMYQSLDFHNV
jgi:hypothetical protein